MHPQRSWNTFVLIVAALVVGVVLAGGTLELQRALASQIDRRSTADAAAQVAQTAQTAARAQLELDTSQRTQSAAVTAWNFFYLMLSGGVSLGLAILLVGGAIALVLWLGVRASAIYPRNGQLPLLRIAGLGYAGFQDASRLHSPLALVRVPTLFDFLIFALQRASGKPVDAPRPSGDVPLFVTEPTAIALGAQASTVAMVAASGGAPRGRAGGAALGSPIGLAVQELAGQAPARLLRALPPVERIPAAPVQAWLAQHPAPGELVNAD